MAGRDNNPRAGYSGDPRETPADLAAVQADDAFLDMLGSANRMPGDADGELTRVLAAWRREVHADSNRVLVDTDTALAVIKAARRPTTRRRNPVFGTLAAAAAVMVIAFSAVGLVAKSAHPGDQLWGVTQVLYGDYARSVETAAVVKTELYKAEKAFQQGDPEKAQSLLRGIQQQLPAIGEAEGRTEFTARHQDLKKMLDKQAGGSTPGSATGSPDPGSSARTVAPEPSTSPSATAVPTEPVPTTQSGSTTQSVPTTQPVPTTDPDSASDSGDDPPELTRPSQGESTRSPRPQTPPRPDRPDVDRERPVTPNPTMPTDGDPRSESGAVEPDVPTPPG